MFINQLFVTRTCLNIFLLVCSLSTHISTSVKLRNDETDTSVNLLKSANWFLAGLRKLRELDLSFNRLQSLPSCVFSALANLEFLSLKSNELEDVRERTLAGLNFLTFLDLSSNLLVDIHPDALNPLKGQRSVVIDVRRNRLRRPRKQWIAAAREQTYSCSSTFFEQTSHANARSLSYHAVKHAEASSNDRNQLENATSPLLLANSSESDKNFPSRKKRSLFTRVLWADKNLWDCSCSKSFDSFEFLQVVSSLSAFNTLSYSATKSSPSGCLEVLQENFVIVQQEKGYFSLWDITMSCDTPVELQGHSFASPFKVGPAMLQSCCSANRSFQTAHHRNVCLNVTNWITKSKANCTVVRPPESGLKESEVTIIGILIVVLVPVFLTLCPDCDRTVVPTQRMQYNSVVVGGTYVGGCAGNMNVCNNNVMRLPQVWTPNLDRDEVFEKPAAKETGVWNETHKHNSNQNQLVFEAVWLLLCAYRAKVMKPAPAAQVPTWLEEVVCLFYGSFKFKTFFRKLPQTYRRRQEVLVGWCWAVA